MRVQRLITVLLVFTFAALLLASCGRRSESFVIALDANPSTLDPHEGNDAAADRLRQLMFNSLVRKNERFEYVGDLASNYTVSDEGRTYTFTLHDNVTFHNGQPLTSADVKYSFDSLLGSTKRKAPSFFESGPNIQTRPFINAIETPDPRTVVFRLSTTWTQLLPNLVAIAIIPQGSADAQKQQPVGSGPFRFVNYDESQQTINMEAYENYWQGAPEIKALRVRAILDANTLQAELRSGRIDLAPGASNLSPDAYKVLAQDQNLKVEQFPGANIVYLGFNCESAPVNNVKVRQAISHAVDREGIVRDLLLGQARVAHSILPEESWAYTAGQQYPYDPARAKQLLDEAGFRDPDGDGPRMRFDKPLIFRISSGNAATAQFAGVIQNSLKQVGVPAEIETSETNSLIDQMLKGQFQMATLRWVGGNQDPSFLRDLFATSEIPTPQRASRNRSRYSNPELDRILDEAVRTFDREKARALYVQAQEILSREAPMLPLWYPSVLAVARKNVSNIKIDPSNDWSFVRNLKVEK